jgi:hypothetical protein
MRREYPKEVKQAKGIDLVVRIYLFINGKGILSKIKKNGKGKRKSSFFI